MVVGESAGSQDVKAMGNGTKATVGPCLLAGQRGRCSFGVNNGAGWEEVASAWRIVGAFGVGNPQLDFQILLRASFWEKMDKVDVVLVGAVALGAALFWSECIDAGRDEANGAGVVANGDDWVGVVGRFLARVETLDAIRYCQGVPA